MFVQAADFLVQYVEVRSFAIKFNQLLILAKHLRGTGNNLYCTFSLHLANGNPLVTHNKTYPMRITSQEPEQQDFRPRAGLVNI